MKYVISSILWASALAMLIAGHLIPMEGLVNIAQVYYVVTSVVALPIMLLVVAIFFFADIASATNKKYLQGIQDKEQPLWFPAIKTTITIVALAYFGHMVIAPLYAIASICAVGVVAYNNRLVRLKRDTNCHNVT